MVFEDELWRLKQDIKEENDIDELDYIWTRHEKKYWWASIFIFGLFYALNGAVGRWILILIGSVITLTLVGWIAIYLSYRDQKRFNQELDHLIRRRKKELASEKIMEKK